MFVRNGLIWHLHLDGEVIRTTAEHPFFTPDRGWVGANELKVGDWLLTEGGRWRAVSDILDTGCWETVYNVRIADHHTYFVGDSDDGSAIWAHNANYNLAAIRVIALSKQNQVLQYLRSLGNGNRYSSGGSGSAVRTPFGLRHPDITVRDKVGNVIAYIEVKSGDAVRSSTQKIKDWWIATVQGIPTYVIRVQ